MAYRLKRGEPVSNAIKRIAREELAEAALTLRGGPNDTAIHEARKSLKKVRALLRLVRRDLDSQYRVENARLRGIGRKLSPLRDAKALIEAVERMAEHHRVPSPVRNGLLRQKLLIEKRSGVRELAKAAAVALDDERERVDQWPLETNGFAAIEGGLKAAFRRGKKAFAKYRRSRRREDLHEWRKRVKDHWYHVRLLEDLWTPALKGYEHTLKTLEDLLGETLNLWMLHDQLPVLHTAFETTIERERKELLGRAVKLGEQIYSEKTRRLVKRVRCLWDQWDSQKAIGGTA